MILCSVSAQNKYEEQQISWPGKDYEIKLSNFPHLLCEKPERPGKFKVFTQD